MSSEVYAGAHNLRSGPIEIVRVVREIGIIPTELELQMMIDELDKDGSGDIDLNEFVTGVSVTHFQPKAATFRYFAHGAFLIGKDVRA